MLQLELYFYCYQAKKYEAYWAYKESCGKTQSYPTPKGKWQALDLLDNSFQRGRHIHHAELKGKFK